MPDHFRIALAGRVAAAVLALAAAGCASHEPAAPPTPSPDLAAAPTPASSPAPATPPPAAMPEQRAPVVAALAHADRVRGMPPAELAGEVARLSAAPAPLSQVELALTLMQTRAATDALRANLMLQRVLAQDTADARPLHPLCRQLLAQLAEQRRLEDIAERQAQQLRDAQRRAEQLADRLDALRAIERARPRLP